MLRTSLTHLWRQLFGGKDRARTVNRKARSVRLTVESLEGRIVPSLVHKPVPVQNFPVFNFTSATLVNAQDQPLTTVNAGEQVYVQAKFTTEHLPSFASYRIMYTVNGITKETGPLTWGAGSSGTGSWIAYWGSWTAAPGTNQVTVTSSYADNSKSFSFTTVPGPVAYLVLSAPASTTVGASFQVSVTAEDSYGYQTPYTGTASLDCGLSGVPNPTILVYPVPLTNGQGSIPVTFSQVGRFQLDVSMEVSGRLSPQQLAWVVVNPALPPAQSFISGPYLESNYPTNTATWYLQNTSSYTISVHYEVINYKNGVEFGPIDQFTLTFSPHSSHPTAGGEWFPLDGPAYTSKVVVLNATYV